MPHTILEYTASVIDLPEFPDFWGELHRMLAETAPCRIQDIKSRAYRCEDFYMADGAGDLAFVHLAIQLMEGRDDATLARIGTGALELLKKHFPVTFNQLQADFTVEIRGMRREAYFKATAQQAP